jgi:hypothetical protein
MMRPIPLASACAALAWLFLPTTIPAAAQARAAQSGSVHRMPCGAYEAVPSGTGPSGLPTRLSIQKAGRLLLTVSDWSITRLECADINDDKTVELLVTTFSGGSHCCETLRIWALGASPRPLLRFASGHARGFDLRDLDGDGRRELLLGDDAFAYFDDLGLDDSPSPLPFTACFAEGRFQDCTTRLPAPLRAELARYAARLRLPAGAAETRAVEGAALGVLALSVLLGEEERGLATVRQAVPDEAVERWLERARPRVRDWAHERTLKLKDGREK